MNKHVKMDETYARRLDEAAQGVIGNPLARPEGPLKVSGRATYAAEETPTNLATGFLVRATITKGRVTGVDAAAVESMPGVLGVFRDKRFVRNPAQGMANESPVQDPDTIAYLGQPIALVVAESFEQARHAAQNLKVTYAEEAGSVDPESPDAKVEKPDAQQLDQGDMDAAIRDAAASVDATYTTPAHTSAPMEPHASLAEWKDDDLTLRGSYQMLKFNRNELADALGIDPKRVRILSPYVGGGFGSKLGIAPEAVSAAIAAKELGRPVRVVMSRQQVFEGTMRRSETRQRVRLAADAEGRLTGLEHDSRVSSLFDESFSEPVQQATHFLYGGENRRYVSEIVRLNRTCAGSVRAPGEAVGMLALENALDELAEKLDMDPVELRLRNIPDRHPEEDIPYSAHGLGQCLREGAERFGWKDRNAKPRQRREGEWLVGVGMATAARTNSLMESKARVTLRPDGTALVETDMTDIGTGTYAILGQIAGEMLGLPVEKVEVRLGDTDYPPASGSGGSWGAQSSGSSVFLACESLREEIAKKLGCEVGELTLKDGTATGANHRKPLAELVGAEEMVAEGHIEPGKMADEYAQAGYGAHFAEVAVNTVTGETRVRRMLGVFALGRVLNEKTARSQCHGGMIWGIGTALTEEIMHDPRDGHIVNRDLAEYHMPVNLDVPALDVHFIDERDDQANPIQAKGIGELGISGAGAAITNAIYNACGVRIRDYPATLDKVLAGLDD